MHLSRFDLLTIHYNGDLSGPLRLTAPDAAVYVERPAVPIAEEKDGGMFDTFPGDLLLARVALLFERVEAIAQRPGDDDTVLCLSGPDARRCDDASVVCYHQAVSAGLPAPTDLPLAHLLVRHGALRAFVVEQRSRAMIDLLERWQDTSWDGLQRLTRLHQQIEKGMVDRPT